MDEEDLAFKQKQQAGSLVLLCSSDCSANALHRQEGPRRSGQEGFRQRSHGWRRHQEVWQEMIEPTETMPMLLSTGNHPYHREAPSLLASRQHLHATGLHHN